MKITYWIKLFIDLLVNPRRNKALSKDETRLNQSNKLRDDFYYSFCVAFISIIIGIVLGMLFECFSIVISNKILIILQIIGAFFILWASIFNKMIFFSSKHTLYRLTKYIITTLFCLGTISLTFTFYVLY